MGLAALFGVPHIEFLSKGDELRFVDITQPNQVLRVEAMEPSVFPQLSFEFFPLLAT